MISADDGSAETLQASAARAGQARSSKRVMIRACKMVRTLAYRVNTGTSQVQGRLDQSLGPRPYSAIERPMSFRRFRIFSLRVRILLAVKIWLPSNEKLLLIS